MFAVPRAFPRELRDDAIAIARRREVSFARMAKDFGSSETTVQSWVSKAEVEDGLKPGLTSSQQAENRELRKRVWWLEQENEVLRRAAAFLSQGPLP